jgi:4-alpha-glucanotransferase
VTTATTDARCAGILLHPTSLPSGKLDATAGTFLDWMTAAHLTVWQMLPLTEPLDGLSPYQGISAFAFNPALLPDNWQAEVDPQALATFMANPPHWLLPYARFTLLKSLFGGSAWNQWPDIYKFRNPQALAQLDQSHVAELQAICTQQFALIQCWQQLKADANTRGIRLFGDIPIFVAYDSVDVWSNPDEFRLDDNLDPTVVTGVPPDYFSETGQRWGNPHYDWPAHEAEGFAWWLGRLRSVLAHCDLVRIDHFRGFAAAWEISADAPDATQGSWQEAPGTALFAAVEEALGGLPFIAEDLGVITPDVEALRDGLELPGMKVLQFAWGGNPNHPFLPHMYDHPRWVAYTGTHDTDTAVGWYQSADPKEQHRLRVYCGRDGSEPGWDLVRLAWASTADFAIAPLQDVLGLDSSWRMNVPGEAEGNWGFRAPDLPSWAADHLRSMAEAYGRLPPSLTTSS